MRIAIFTPYYVPERGACVSRVEAFYESFKKAGCEVKIFAQARNNIPSTDDVVRCKGYWGLFNALSGFNADVVIGTSPPLPINLACYFAARSGYNKFVLDAKDPFIDVMVNLGALKKGSLKYYLYCFLEHWLHRHSDFVLVGSQGDKDEIVRKFHPKPSKILMVPNGAVEEFFVDYDVPKSNTIVFSGTMGNYELVEFIEKAYYPYRNFANLLLLLNNDKSKQNLMELDKIKTVIGKLDLQDKVEIVENTPYKDLPKRYQGCGVGVIPLPNHFKTTITAKIFDYSASGLPFVAKCGEDSYMKRFMEENDLGFYCKDYGVMREAIKGILFNLEVYRTMAQRQRKFVQENYSREKIAKDLLRAIR